VEVLGLSGVPVAGERFQVVADERAARVITEAAARAGQHEGESEMSIEAVFARIRSGAIKELNLIVKADVQGSVEPIVSSLEKLGDQTETRAKVINSGLGNVNVTNVNLAVASKAMIIAFNVKIEEDACGAAVSSCGKAAWPRCDGSRTTSTKSERASTAASCSTAGTTSSKVTCSRHSQPNGSEMNRQQSAVSSQPA